jgi:hypothetical protein
VCQTSGHGSVYWSVLPTREVIVAVDEATALAVIFGEQGELPAQELN